ncbi:PIN domain-like protein, partial [Spinellus fusiger]
MGIHGLSSFIQEHGTLGKQCVWTASSEPSCFIIDGNAYVYHYALSCKTDWVYGGNYSLMAELVRSHTKALRQANITPIFLFDGALPEDKKTTRVKRYKNYIDKVASVDSNIRQISKSNQDSVSPEDSLQYWGEFYLIPPLTLEVVVQTLRELEVQVIICRDEADGDVVTMAQEKNAYVVSKDSDMYVYPHAGMGYLPLDLLSIGTQVQATVYQPHVLAGFLKLSPFILPLLGTLLGNDYFDIQVVRYPIMEWCTSHGFTLKSQSSAQWPKYVAEFLRTVTEKIALDNVVRVVVETLTPILLDSSMHQRQERADRLENDIIHSICRYDTASPLI